MATQTSLDRVQQLYVAYYGRPADQEGQLYWAERMDAEGEGAIINAFGNSPEYQDRFGELSFGQAVNNLYVQSFNRPADVDGLAYYVGVLERGEKSLAEIATTIINAAGGTDKLTFDAKVAAAAAYTAEFGAADDYDLEAAIAVVAGAEAGADLSALTEALLAYQDAVAAERSFLEAATELEAVLAEDATLDDESDSADIEAAINNAVDTAASDVAGELSDLAAAMPAGAAATKISNYSTSFEDSSPEVQAGMIAEAQAEAAKLVQSAQDEVAKISGQLSKVNALVSAKASYEAAMDAADEAETAATAELQKFNSLNPSVTATVTRTDAASYKVAQPEIPESTAGAGDGQPEAVYITVVNNRLTVTDAGKVLKGIDALFAAAQAEYQALLAEERAEANFEARLVSAYNGEVDTDIAVTDVTVGTGGTDHYSINVDNEITLEAGFTGAGAAQVSANLLAARGVQAELNEAVSDYQAIAQVAADLVSLQTEVEAAAAAIEELGYELAEATAGAAAGTDADDLFVFAGEELTITGFGLEGDDLLFIGEGFEVFSVVSGSDAVTGRLGSSSALELFFQQDGNNAIIYVEEQAFAGNATNANDLVKITLAGVNVEDLQYENGYVSIVEAA